jgi:hypothetical protein
MSLLYVRGSPSRVDTVLMLAVDSISVTSSSARLLVRHLRQQSRLVTSVRSRPTT